VLFKRKPTIKLSESGLYNGYEILLLIILKIEEEQ